MTINRSFKKTLALSTVRVQNWFLFRLPATAVLLVFSLTLSGQQRKIDSLQTVMHTGIQDESHLRAWLELVTLIHESKPQESLVLSKKVLRLAALKHYKNIIPNACNAIGSIHHLLSQYDSSLIFHRRALTAALDINSNLELAQAYQGIAENYLRLFDTDSSEYYFRKELALALEIKNGTLIAGIHNDLGNLYLEKNKLNESLKEYIRAAAIYDSATNNSAGFGKVLVNIGNVECVLGHYKKALDYTKQAITIFQKNNKDVDVAFCLRLIGRIYRKQALYTKALQQYEQVIKIYIRVGEKRGMSETYQNMGNIYYDLGRFKEALTHYEKSLRIGKSINSPKQIAYAYSALGYVWNELHDAKRAHLYIDSSLVRAKQIGDTDLMMDAFETRSDVYANQHNYKEALEAHRALLTLKDSLNTTVNKREGEEMEGRYQNAKKQAQIDLLQKDKQLQASILRQHQLRLTFLGIALLLIIIISFLLLNRNQIIHKTRRQLEIERMRNDVARDLHDNIGSTLSSINIISQVALKENKPDNFPKHFQRIGEQSLKMMENMSDMVWSINPNNDSMEKMIIRMKEFSAEILEPKNIGYNFKGEEIFNNTLLDVGKRKNLFLIFKEVINNAAKYSEGTFITIILSQVDHHLSLVIHDNGKGFDPLKAQTGNGLHNIQERAKEIGSELVLDTAMGLGTTIKLIMPLT